MTAGQGSGPEQDPAGRPPEPPAEGREQLPPPYPGYTPSPARPQHGGSAPEAGSPPGPGFPPPGQAPPRQGYPPPGQSPSGQGYPPPAPGYPPPGQGYPPPAPGYPPHTPPYAPPYAGGYGPAPSAPPGWGGPAPVERPVTVRAGLGAYLGSLTLGVLALIVQLLDPGAVLAQLPQRSGLPEQSVGAIVAVAAIFGFVSLAVHGMFIWFAWRGRNWARIVLWVFGGLGVLSGLTSLGGMPVGGMPGGGFLRALSVFQLFFTLAGVVLLALKPSHEWYRYRRWLQTTGQRG